MSAKAAPAQVANPQPHGKLQSSANGHIRRCAPVPGATGKARTGSLTVIQPELTVLRGIPGTCPSPPQVEVMRKEDKGPVQETAGQGRQLPTAHAAKPRPPERTGYGAAKERAGFPRSMPLGVRDGDGDGVVCER